MSANLAEDGSETPAINDRKKPLLRIPLWFYFSSACAISIIIATAINVGVAYAMYTPEIAAQTAVWAWPYTICGDLVITAAASFLVTWMLTPTIGLNDFIRGFPVETKASTFPRVNRKLPWSWLEINPLFGRDPENPIPKCTAFKRQFRMGIIGAIALAAVLLKGLYGAVTEAICVIFAMVILVVQVSPRMNLLAAEEGSSPADLAQISEP